MSKDNLEGLEFPHLFHKPNHEHRRVETLEDAKEAVKDGWTAHPVLTKEQETAVAKVLTPDQVKADAAIQKAADDAKQAALDATSAAAHAAQVAAHKGAPTPAAVPPHQGNQFGTETKRDR